MARGLFAGVRRSARGLEQWRDKSGGNIGAAKPADNETDKATEGLEMEYDAFRFSGEKTYG